MSDLLDLAVNCGSSSIKFQLFNSSRQVVLKGSAANVQGDSPASYSFKHAKAESLTSGEEPKLEEEVKKELDKAATYEEIFEEILKDVTKEKVLGEKGKERIRLVAHRIVHGGTADEPILIKHGDKEEQEVLDKMDEVSNFAPLHACLLLPSSPSFLPTRSSFPASDLSTIAQNHHAMLIVRHCLTSLPTATSVLCFDTLFHRTIPHYRRIYAIAQPDHDTPVPLVKYGFHGLSYGNIVRQMAEELGKKVEEVNIVVAHLGSGGSCCLIQGGESKQTTMGVTPLEGLPGGTRSGTVDPSLIFHVVPNSGEMVDWSGREISKGEYVLNKESGFKALCGTNNFGEITSRAFPSSSPSASSDDTPQNEEYLSSRLTYNHYLDRLVSFLAPYLSSTFSAGPPNSTAKGEKSSGNKLDALVFSGGIGEKSAILRRDVLAHFSWIEELSGSGGGLDEGRNEMVEGKRWRITQEGSRVPAYVVETSEEDEMVRISAEALEEQEKGQGK